MPRLLVWLDHDDQHLLRHPVLARPPLDVGPHHHRVVGIERLIPDRPNTAPSPRTSASVTFRHGALSERKP